MKTNIFFKSTRDVVKAEKILASANFAIQIVPVPKHISSECGMAVEIDSSFEKKALECLTANGVDALPRPDSFDLLTTVEYGGCSAKLPPEKLAEALSGLPKISHERLLVDISTHDDAGIYKLDEQTALVQTLDFFPPICSDPFEFGQIAAANSLSDVYAMGGVPITAMNIVMFPMSKIPIAVLKEILAGGMERVGKSGALMLGGHTIDDYPPKYGLSVTGLVHPGKIMSNDNARDGELLILAKPLGTGVIVAGRRLGICPESAYRKALDCMKQLNKEAAEIMCRYSVRCATDITGFSLLGHARNIARASKATLVIESSSLPVLEGVEALLDSGCIPGACFRNMSAIEKDCVFTKDISIGRKHLMFDAQTSGGLLFCAPEKSSQAIIGELCDSGYPSSKIVGFVKEWNGNCLEIQ